MVDQYYKVHKDEAIARTLNAPISRKYAVELAREIKRKPVSKVLRYLDDIINLRVHVPVKRYNSDMPHRKGNTLSGVKSGRYPTRVAALFKKVLEAAVNNADIRGLDKEHLLVVGAVADIGVRRFKVQPRGKRRTRVSKAVHLEILVKEIKLKKGSHKESDKKHEKSKKSETQIKDVSKSELKHKE